MDSLIYSEAEVERWNREWLSYLLEQYPQQLSPYTAYPERPELPENPLQMIDVSMDGWATLLVYAQGSAIRDKQVMEFGCGCGNLGKLIACYARTYLGVDCSPLALAIARLVSPANATYLHVNQVDELARLSGTVDTLISRFFWIHQNFETGRRVLRIVEPLLKSGSRLYLDFFWPNPQEAVGFWRTAVDRVRSPRGPLDEESSAMFQYSASEVEELFQDLPFRVIQQQEHGPTQRRYVVAEKTS
jgi:SAM-dependent methyltransferase